MLDPVKVEVAEAEIDRFIERQAKRTGADEANAIEAMWRASERREEAKRREENRQAWCEYLRRVSASHLKAARSARARARALEANE